MPMHEHPFDPTPQNCIAARALSVGAYPDIKMLGVEVITTTGETLAVLMTARQIHALAKAIDVKLNQFPEVAQWKEVHPSLQSKPSGK